MGKNPLTRAFAATLASLALVIPPAFARPEEDTTSKKPEAPVTAVAKAPEQKAELSNTATPAENVANFKTYTFGHGSAVPIDETLETAGKGNKNTIVIGFVIDQGIQNATTFSNFMEKAVIKFASKNPDVSFVFYRVVVLDAQSHLNEAACKHVKDAATAGGLNPDSIMNEKIALPAILAFLPSENGNVKTLALNASEFKDNDPNPDPFEVFRAAVAKAGKAVGESVRAIRAEAQKAPAVSLAPAPR
ncbi:MAG: hypothetical protein L6Q57_08485 [Alphaproteobacteria bacterium]|nr:hypothetical protein [Alphaproteobacteria bacterium]